MKVKKNYYYIFSITVFILVSIIILKQNNFFSKLSNVINFIHNKEITLDIRLDSDFLNYIKNEQNQIDVKKYSINIELFHKSQEIKADLVITGDLKKSIPEIVLNFTDGFSISKVYFNNNLANFTYKNNYLKVKNTSNSNNFSIKVIYKGKPKSKGFGSFVFDKINNLDLVYSLNEPIFASTWFPCNDKPDDKALFETTITNDKKYVSVSNGIFESSVIKGNKTSYSYKTLNELSTYLFAIYSGDYKFFEDYVVCENNDTTRLVYYVLDENSIEDFIDFKPHKRGIQVFTKLFGSYPFIKEKYGIAEITWKMGAMEHQTITAMDRNLIKAPQSNESIYIHELAHQWWGNAVGLKDWKDIWLNEGFATYSEALYYENENGKDAFLKKMNSFKGDFTQSTLYNPTCSLFDKLVYNKGAWVLHMLRKELGDKIFFLSLKTYYEKYKYKNASTEDFKSVCQSISNKNLNIFFEQWVYKGKGKINLEYSLSSSTNGTKIQFKQKGYKYSFPLEIMFDTDKTKNIIENFIISSQDTTILLSKSKEIKNVILDPNNWLLLNIDKP